MLQKNSKCGTNAIDLRCLRTGCGQPIRNKNYYFCSRACNQIFCSEAGGQLEVKTEFVEEIFGRLSPIGFHASQKPDPLAGLSNSWRAYYSRRKRILIPKALEHVHP